jgi:hypothetical protein
MLIILIVGIAGIWIGACIWRRRYVKRKERAHQLGKHSGSATNPTWGPDAGAGAGAAVTGAAMAGKNGSGPRGPPGPPGPGAPPGMFMHGAAAAYDEKSKPAKKAKEKRKWVVKERT